MGFINAELTRIEVAIIPPDRIIDTLALARRKHPAGPNSLDALCKRYNVDNSARTRHGALLDAELLAEVYLQLIGGQQPVSISPRGAAASRMAGRERVPRAKRARPLPANLEDAEKAAHAAFIEEMGAEALWRLYR